MVSHFEQSVARLLKFDGGFIVLAGPLLINDDSGDRSSNVLQRLTVSEKREIGPAMPRGAAVEQHMMQPRDPVAFQPGVIDIIKSFRVHQRPVRHLYDVKVAVRRSVINTKPAEG